MTDPKQVKKAVLILLICIVLFAVIAFLPSPAGLTQQAMIYMGIFMVMIILLTTGILYDWLVMMVIMCSLVISKVGTVGEVFGIFGGSTMWLVIMVFALAVSLGNSGLMNRIALRVLSFFPQSYSGQVVALMSSGLVLGPLIPSISAKVNMLAPVSAVVSEQIGIEEHSKPALGLFSATVMSAYFCANAFLSGSVYIPMMLAFMPVETQARLTWGGWFGASCVWLTVILIGIYLFCAVYCRPKEKIKISSDLIKTKLKELGPMSTKEKIAGTVLTGLLVIWITSSFHGIDSGIIGWIGICIMAACGLFSTQEFIAKIPWSLVVYVGGLLSVSSFMRVLGLSEWISSLLTPILGPVASNPWLFVVVVVLTTYVIRYVIIDANLVAAIMLAIFGASLDLVGISHFVLIYVAVTSTMTWSTTYQNMVMIASLQVAGGRYVAYSEFRSASYAYMIMNFVAMLASVPLWMALGYIR